MILVQSFGDSPVVVQCTDREFTGGLLDVNQYELGLKKSKYDDSIANVFG